MAITLMLMLMMMRIMITRTRTRMIRTLHRSNSNNNKFQNVTDLIIKLNNFKILKKMKTMILNSQEYKKLKITMGLILVSVDQILEMTILYSFQKMIWTRCLQTRKRYIFDYFNSFYYDLPLFNIEMKILYNLINNTNDPNSYILSIEFAGFYNKNQLETTISFIISLL